MNVRCPWCKKNINAKVFSLLERCPKCNHKLRKFVIYKYTPWEALLILGLPLGGLFAAANYMNDTFFDFAVLIFYPLAVLAFAFDNLQVGLKRDQKALDEELLEDQNYSKLLLGVLFFISVVFLVVSYRIVSS